MRKRYHVDFLLGQEEGASTPSLEDVSQVCLDWILQGSRISLPSGHSPILPATDLTRTDLGNGAWLEAIRVGDGSKDRWGMRFGHPDETDSNLTWMTEICTGVNPEANEASFSCTVKLGSSQGRLVPIYRKASRPRIVPTVLQQWGGRRVAPLSLEPIVVTPDEVPYLVGLLRSQDRSLPVVFISTSNWNDHTLVQPDKLGNWIGGLAHVLIGQNRFTSLKLSKAIPERLGCWDGAIRIWWPGFSLSDEPYQHKVWKPDFILQKEETSKHGFTEYLLGWLSRIAVGITDPRATSWADLGAIRRHQLFEEAKAAGQQDDLIELAELELQEKDATIEDLKLQVEQLSEEVKDARQREESWREAWKQVGAATAPESPDGTDEPGTPQPEVTPLESVMEAVERAQDEFSEQLVFAPNGKSSVSGNPFEEPGELFSALEFLATTYFIARTGEEGCSDFQAALHDHVDWSFQANQSQITMGKYENWYTTRWEGRKYWLPNHIGTGSSKDPRYTIRVAFEWDKDRKKVVIGYIGQHQQTDAT